MPSRLNLHHSRLIAVAVIALSSLTATTLRGVPQVKVIPAGTPIAIRMIDAVDSDAPANEYRASLDDAVTVGGVTLVPVSPQAALQLFRVQQAGAVRGQTAITLRLVALDVDGRRVTINSGDATIRSDSQAKSATKKGILGALIGSAIGAAIDGKAGAAKGAALGGAAGVAAAVVVGQRVQVPSETRLSFTLSQNVVLP